MIDAKGFKAIFLKKLTISEKKITGIAYRDGKGGITLGLTTFEQTRHWDLVLANPLDAKTGDERMQWYYSIFSETIDPNDQTEECYKQLFANLMVAPLTVKQNTPDWFLLRAFSCTSSATDQLLNELKKIYHDPKTSTLINEATTAALQTILDLVQGPRWDQRVLETTLLQTSQDCEVVPSLSSDDNPVHSNVAENGENERIDKDEEINLNMNILMSGTTTSIETQIKDQVANNSPPGTVLKKYLEKIGLKPVKDYKKNIEKFKKWLDEAPSKRPYVLWNKSRLVDACVSKFGGKKSTYNGYDNNNLIHRLATYQSHPSNHRQNSSQSSTPAVSYVRTSLLKRILESSFMPKLTAQGREYCKMGHALELPFARKLLQHSKEGLTKFSVERIYRVGLVSKRGRPYAKASCDFVAAISIDGEKKLAGVE